MWDNSVFDRAFDSVGLRQRVRRIKNGVVIGEFRGRFDKPQVIVLDGIVHTTDYVLEFTTNDIRPKFSYDDEVEIEVCEGSWERYRVIQEPLEQGDGHWTRVELEKI